MKRAPRLTLRLTALFAAASTAVILALGFVIGSAVDQHFIEQDLDILSGKLEQVRQVLSQDSGANTQEILPQRLDDALTGHRGLAIAVISPRGETVFATRDAGFPHELLARPVTAVMSAPLVWKNVQGRPFRGIAQRMKLVQGGDAVVAVATDISHHEQFMASFRSTLWWSVLVAAIVTGLLGWFAVRRGLAPLQAMKRKAEAMTVRRLDERLVIESVPAELADLAHTLNGTFARLETSFRRLSDFSSDLAHEFRSPISNLLTQTQVTLSRPRSEAVYREVLGSNIEEYERLARMVADMLLLAQADEGQLPLTLEPLELAPLLRNLLDFYGVVAEEKSVTFVQVGDGAIEADSSMIRRAVGNLLSNAIRHADVGSVVHVTVSQDEAQGVIEVANAGPDIPTDSQTRLFDRFYRADAARSGNGQQTGLGLAIVRSIVEAHGGRVSVNSGQGQTRFALVLPRNRHRMPNLNENGLA